jgi:hypothetical protein
MKKFMNTKIFLKFLLFCFFILFFNNNFNSISRFSLKLSTFMFGYFSQYLIKYEETEKFIKKNSEYKKIINFYNNNILNNFNDENKKFINEHAYRGLLAFSVGFSIATKSVLSSIIAPFICGLTTNYINKNQSDKVFTNQIKEISKNSLVCLLKTLNTFQNDYFNDSKNE